MNKQKKKKKNKNKNQNRQIIRNSNSRLVLLVPRVLTAFPPPLPRLERLSEKKEFCVFRGVSGASGRACRPRGITGRDINICWDTSPYVTRTKKSGEAEPTPCLYDLVFRGSDEGPRNNFQLWKPPHGSGNRLIARCSDNKRFADA